MQIALLALFAPLVVATVSLEEFVCGINKARAEKKLPALYSGPTFTKVAQENADGNVPNFPMQKTLDALNKQKYAAKNIGVAMVSGCTKTEECLRGFLKSYDKLISGKFTAIALVKSGKWYVATLVDAKSADLKPGQCGLENPDPPNKADVEGGEIGKLDTKILLCLINKERAKEKLPVLGYSEVVNRVAAKDLKTTKLDIFDALERENVDDATSVGKGYGMGCISEKQCLELFLKSGDLRKALLMRSVNVAGFATTEDNKKLLVLLVGAKSLKTQAPTQC